MAKLCLIIKNQRSKDLRIRSWLASIVLFLFLGQASFACATYNKINLFVASSLIDVTQKIASEYSAQNLCGEITIIAGSSSILSRQINAGAPAHIFISADFYNADLIAKKSDQEPEILFGNRLVLIAPDNFTDKINLQQLPDRLGDNRLAMGDPAHVPAGIYAKQALISAGIWGDIKDRLAPAGNVRAASAFVLKGASPFGIVYETEARIDGIKKLALIDDSLHASISYWGVIISKENKGALDFFNYIKSLKAQEILHMQGFKTNLNE